MNTPNNLSFADFFKVSATALKKYGAFNTSLVSDVPLFVDPFLLFNSEKEQYKILHAEIIKYLVFLKNKTDSLDGNLPQGLIDNLYRFPEVEQNWFGYSVLGNKGRGLGKKFAISLNESFGKVLNNFGNEKITEGIHLEKITLVHDGVGKDNISDFTTNLIKGFLLEYTQAFTHKNIDPSLTKIVKVKKAKFNYDTETWMSMEYTLPHYVDDYVLLTPIDLLTKNDIWINRKDLFDEFEKIPTAITNSELRAQINNYFQKLLVQARRKDKNGKFAKEEPTRAEKDKAAFQTIKEFPVLIDYYVKQKEDKGDIAVELSLKKTEDLQEYYIDKFKNIITRLIENGFYNQKNDTYEESLSRVISFKKCIENNDIYKDLYDKDGCPRTEDDVQRLFYLVWYGTVSDVNRESANGRGAVDYSVSRGNKDKTLIEFKLAKSSQLKKNLQNQLEIYKKVNSTEKSIWVIVYFTSEEHERAKVILEELKLNGKENIILIDARKDNKPTASKAG